MSNVEKFPSKCVLCGVVRADVEANNPWRLAEEGQCCNACNAIKVIPARLGLTITAANTERLNRIWDKARRDSNAAAAEMDAFLAECAAANEKPRGPSSPEECAQRTVKLLEIQKPFVATTMAIGERAERECLNEQSH